MPKRCAAALVVCIVLVVAVWAAARAHAYVLTSSPPADATLDTSPDRVVVAFDEPISLESREAVVVRDHAGAIDPCEGKPYVNPDDVRQIVCRLARPLPAGSVHVSWRVTSADTHVVHGEFSFGIATVVHARAGETRSVYDPSGIPATVFRWLTLLGSLAIAGGLAFAVLVLADDVSNTAPLRARCAGLVRGGIVVAIAGAVGALVVQCAAATGTDAIRGLARADEVLTGSVWGWMWLARIGALATIALLARAHGPAAALALAAAGVLLATLSVSGHALVAATPSTAVIADWVHLAAAAVWSGGIFVLMRGPVSGATVARFSQFAIGSVATIVLTGIWGSLAHVPSPAALFGTAYGLVIIAKAVLLVPLLLLGYQNFRRGRSGAGNLDITATVAREAVLVLVVIALSAVLTGLPLPHSS
jgi:copper transport protein